MADENITVFAPLDDLYLMVSEAKKVPLTQKIMLDQAAVQQLVEDIKNKIPSELVKAREIITQEAQIINESNRQARETHDSADAYAKETRQKADEYAAAKRAQADSDAQNAVNSANKYKVDTIEAATQEANSIVANSQQQADQIKADAQLRAAQMTDQSQIVLLAQQKAHDIQEATNRMCEEQRQRTFDTLNRMLDRTDSTLAMELDNLRQIRQEIFTEN